MNTSVGCVKNSLLSNLKINNYAIVVLTKKLFSISIISFFLHLHIKRI